jgi:hypothetical protein
MHTDLPDRKFIFFVAGISGAVFYLASSGRIPVAYRMSCIDTSSLTHMARRHTRASVCEDIFGRINIHKYYARIARLQ